MTLLARTRALTGREWRVLIETAALTPVAAVAVRGLPLPKAVELVLACARCRRPSRPVGGGPTALSADRMATLVGWGASRLGAQCLVQAIVLQAVLRRRGVRSDVVLGVAPGGPIPAGAPIRLRAHAWVEHDGAVLMGAVAVPYEPLCRLSGDSARAGAIV